MMTIEQIADKFSVDKTTAYGLVRFCEKTGVLKATGTVARDPHQRGRASQLYTFDDEVISGLAGLLASLTDVAAAPAAEASTEQPPAQPAVDAAAA